MGNPKQKWTAEEEEALRAGVAKHGAGKWKLIQRDPEFNSFLHSRSNIDLKDKWRNLGGCGSGINLRDKSRNIKPKVSLDVQCNTLVAEQTSSAVVLYDPSDNPAVAQHDPSDSPAMENSSKCSLDAKSTVMFNSMIFEALSTLNEPSGSDIGAIVSFIEREHEIPPNFRRSLGSRLRKLAALNKIEKVQHRYKMKADASLAVRTPLLTQKREIRVSQPWTQNTRDEPPAEYTEAAAANAALMISDAETKSYVAAEAVKEMERVLRMAEDADSMLQFATEIFDRCSGGEVLMMA